jgi:hypothetical protein
MAEDSGLVPSELGQSQTTAVFALYDTHQEAEAAIRGLQRSGCDLRRLSVIGRDYYTEQGVVGLYTSGDQKKVFGQTGTFWGGLLGLMSGSAFLLVPGIGPLFVAGPVVARIVGEIEEAATVGGTNALGAALYHIGVPQSNIVEYEKQIRAGTFVLIAHGSQEEIDRAKPPLAASGGHGLSEYTGRR